MLNPLHPLIYNGRLLQKSVRAQGSLAPRLYSRERDEDRYGRQAN